MAALITSPQTAMVDRTKGLTIQWSGDLVSYQTHYEIQYKLSSAASWSTLGKTASTSARSYALSNLFNAVQSDATEIYYRIVLYYSYTNSSNESITGYEYSNTYSIIFHGAQVGIMKVQVTSTKKQEYPIYSSVTGKESMDVKLSSSTTGKAILVDSTNPLANQLKVRTTSSRTDFVAGNSPEYTHSGEYQKGYI